MVDGLDSIPKRLLRRYGFLHLPKRLRAKIIRESQLKTRRIYLKDLKEN